MNDAKSENAMKQLRVSSTEADDAHGSNVIEPGDVVEYDGHDARVIDVYPEEQKLRVYPYRAFDNTAETVYARSITGYTAREDYDE